MKNFTEKINPNTTVSILPSLCPNVLISKEALTKMYLFVDNCADEIGWLGTAIKHKNAIHITDVLLFDQDVAATTTEITPEGLAEFGEELLNESNGMEIWNNIKVWGHSHVNMAVSPSGQDNEQMVTFSKCGLEWFIRIIANKSGDLKIDFYDYVNGIIFSDVPWVECITDEEQRIQDEIAKLEKHAAEINKKFITTLNAGVITDIKSKVKKKYYNTGYGSGFGGFFDNNDFFYNQTVPIPATVMPAKEKEVLKLSADAYEIYEYFSYEELLQISKCTNATQVRFLVDNLGYEDVFDDEEILNIWNFGIKLNRTSSIYEEGVI